MASLLDMIGDISRQRSQAASGAGGLLMERPLENVALATMFTPVVGDVTGLLADAKMYATEPEERNLLNYGLTAAGLVPFVPAVATMKKGILDNVDTSYRASHQPSGPMDESPVRLDDLTTDVYGNQAGYPADFYSNEGQRIYAPSARFQGDDYGQANTESYNAIVSVKGEPEEYIEIYRAVPDDKSIDTINPGDFVTLSPKYAELHALSGYGRSGDESGKVLTKKVRVKDIYFAGDDVNEFGYFPSDILAGIDKEVDEAKKLWERTGSDDARKNYLRLRKKRDERGG